MYGLITRMTAKPGRREELAELMSQGLANRPGCLSYIVAYDAASTDGVWVTEAWTSEDAHRASLADPAVKALTTRGWTMVAGIDDSVFIEPVGGRGLG